MRTYRSNTPPPTLGKRMKKKDPTITLQGVILREIEEEGKAQGLDWKVPPLFITRNEQSEENIEKRLARLMRKVNRQRTRNPSKDFPWPTREDALAYLPFPTYDNIKGKWRKYTREQADELKQKIKEVRKYV